MNRIAVSLLLLMFAVAGLAMTARAQQETPPEEASQPQSPPEAPMTACKPDRILVKARPGVDAAALVARYGGTIVQTISGIDVHVVTVPAGKGQQAIDAMTADPEVEFAEADGVVTVAQAGAGC